ncbi:hypothetical protein H7827_27830 [Streptomyces sp. JH002]|uniref:hypothetical protein n=1 Tax=Streptomyces sp. JH002 TaxID=2763259 RepID=UPI003D803524
MSGTMPEGCCEEVHALTRTGRSHPSVVREPDLDRHTVRTEPDASRREELDWYIQHHPDSAQWTIGEILRETNARWDIPAHDTGRALRSSLSMDGQMSKDDLEKYFELVIPREPTS